LYFSCDQILFFLGAVAVIVCLHWWSLQFMAQWHFCPPPNRRSHKRSRQKRIDTDKSALGVLLGAQRKGGRRRRKDVRAPRLGPSGGWQQGRRVVNQSRHTRKFKVPTKEKKEYTDLWGAESRGHGIVQKNRTMREKRNGESCIPGALSSFFISPPKERRQAGREGKNPWHEKKLQRRAGGAQTGPVPTQAFYRLNKKRGVLR
jgi:hypothetical protein